MSSSDKNRESNIQPRLTRSTRSNTVISDNIIHEYPSERKPSKAKGITPLERTIEHGDTEQVVEERNELETSTQVEAAGQSEERTTEQLGEKNPQEKEYSEIEALTEKIQELKLAKENPQDITIDKLNSIFEHTAKELSIEEHSEARPDTPTVHQYSDTDNSDAESVATIVEDLSLDDIESSSLYLSALQHSSTLDEYFTPVGTLFDTNGTPIDLETIKRSLFPVKRSSTNKLQTKTAGTGTIKKTIQKKTTPQRKHAKDDLTNNSESDTETIDNETAIQVVGEELDNPIRMATSGSKVTLKDALTVVPSYDGTTSSLRMFIQGCEEALQMMDRASEPQLVKAVRIKISGEARRCIMQHPFETMKELHAFLKTIYSPVRNIYQLQGELGTIYQKEDESVIAFSNRVRDLGYQILEAYESEHDGVVETAFKKNTEDSLPSCFLQGLKPEIEQRMMKEGTIDEIVKRAVKIEKQLIARSTLRGENKENAKETKAETKRSVKAITREEIMCQLCNETGHTAAGCLTKPNAQNTPAQGSDGQENNIPVCQTCNKRGHTADKCFKNFPPPKNNFSVGATTITVCQFCNKRGHTAEKCFKLFPPINKNNENNAFCQLCKKPGHAANNCPTRPVLSNNAGNRQNPVPQNLQFPQASDILCQICKKPGHGAALCPYRHNSAQCANAKPQTYAEAAGGRKLIGNCHYCQQPGHFVRECPAKQANEARSTGNANGLPTAGGSGTALTAHPVHTISVASTHSEQ